MTREGGQVRAAEAGRRGSVGHVEVFRMDGVGTSIVGRPRRLSADRRARPTYTLIWEEPTKCFRRRRTSCAWLAWPAVSVLVSFAAVQDRSATSMTQTAEHDAPSANPGERHSADLESV